jgi:hypothetical protein
MWAAQLPGANLYLPGATRKRPSSSSAFLRPLPGAERDHYNSDRQKLSFVLSDVLIKEIDSSVYIYQHSPKLLVLKPLSAGGKRSLLRALLFDNTRL